MNKFIITYDLKAPTHNYAKLIEQIKVYHYSKICKSVWLVKSIDDASQIRSNLESYVTIQDRLFIAELTGEIVLYNCIDSEDNINNILY